ncbi:MAG: exodeoxyribonuclease VII small subunit [Poseidonia sp.]
MTNDTMTYDEALRRLEDLVSQLERGGKNLDETLAMFAEGTALLKRCQQELGEVEGRLAELRLDDAEDLVKDEN